MPEYIIDTDHNDGCTAPELHDEAVALVGKLNPKMLVRCRDCKHYEPENTWEEYRDPCFYEVCGEPPTCTLGYALLHLARYTHSDGYCAWGERREEACR